MELKSYIGIPFVEKGRSLDGCDCWGLVKLFYENEYGIKLPDLLNYEHVNDLDSIAKIIQEQKPKWIRVKEWEMGDVIVMNIRGSETHVGIYMGNQKILHTLEKIGSFLGDLKNPSWFTVNRIEGGYRYV